MNGSRAGTADRARAAGIVNAEPPPNERGDSSGLQARYRCRARAFRPRTAIRRTDNIAEYDEICVRNR